MAVVVIGGTVLDIQVMRPISAGGVTQTPTTGLLNLPSPLPSLPSPSQAQPTADDLQRGSSVPGFVVQLPGGVGRNIAEAAHHLLARAGQQQQQQQQQQQAVLLVSVVGQDAAADALLASFAHTG
jgi:sugar/nucleoside kinase (ribokinase family)